MFSVEKIKRVVDDHRDEAIECLVEAIQSPSPTGSEKPMADTALRWIDEIGFEREVYEYQTGRPNIIARWNGERTGKAVFVQCPYRCNAAG